jgi:hypothetical protein
VNELTLKSGHDRLRFTRGYAAAFEPALALGQLDEAEIRELLDIRSASYGDRCGPIANLRGISGRSSP